VWKADGEHVRLIIWPHSLNQHKIADLDCCLPKLSAELSRLYDGGARCAASLDFVGWFNQFELSDDTGALFAFRVDGSPATYVQPTRLPMGWRASNALAQRVCLLLLRAAGIAQDSLSWIDNLLLVAPDEATLQHRLDRLAKVCAAVGAQWTVESRGPQVQYLGMDLNFATGKWTFKESFQSKVSALSALTESRDPSVSFLELQRICGLANWSCLMPGKSLMHIHNLLSLLSTESRRRYEGVDAPDLPPLLKVSLPPACVQELAGIIAGIGDTHELSPLVYPSFPEPLWTDASTGMGAWICGDHWAQWIWTDQDSHINEKELATLREALLHCPSGPIRLTWCTDSQVCWSVCQHKYTRSARLTPILLDILHICDLRQIQLDCQWVPTDMQKADLPSRVILGPLGLRTAQQRCW
jgi:hypothetical protein